MSRINGSWMGVNSGYVESPFGRSRPRGSLKVAKRFEGRRTRSSHDGRMFVCSWEVEIV